MSYPVFLERGSNVLQGNEMSKKDVTFIVALLLILEYVIFDWTYRFGADKVLLDHISFAGTIISIILAVVAIIYSESPLVS